jgi:hypothetical protein
MSSTVECPRCHGSGKIAARAVTAEQQAELDRLAEAGHRRATANRQTLAGRGQLDQAYADIRILEPEAKRLGLTRDQIAEAVGVSRAQLHNILAHRTAD